MHPQRSGTRDLKPGKLPMKCPSFDDCAPRINHQTTAASGVADTGIRHQNNRARSRTDRSPRAHGETESQNGSWFDVGWADAVLRQPVGVMAQPPQPAHTWEHPGENEEAGPR